MLTNEAGITSPVTASMVTAAACPAAQAARASLPSGLAVAWDAHLEAPPQVEDWVTPERMEARRQALGLTWPGALEFTSTCEFVSLGCYCATARALQACGLKANSYPFDWVRSDVDGVIHCIDTQFIDFLTYSSWREEGAYRVFSGTRWGGSFWHHDLESPKTVEDMQRRIKRFYGRAEVPAAKPRVFIRNVNSSREIDAAHRLLESLKRACPEAVIRLLLIIDFQKVVGPVCLAGDKGSDLLIFRVHESLYASAQPGKPLQVVSEYYAVAIAFAVNYWAGSSAALGATLVADSLQHAGELCVQWDGGDPSKELFAPRRFRGLQLLSSSTPALPGLIDSLQLSNQILPVGVLVTEIFFTHAFGLALQIMLPPGTTDGHLLQMCFSDGMLSAAVYSLLGGVCAPVGFATITVRANQLE